MVPAAVFKRDCEHVHDRVVQRLAGGLRVHLLRVVRAGADDVVGVVRGVQHDGLDLCGGLAGVRDGLLHAAGQVDRGLRLVLGGVLLGVGVQDGALFLAVRRQRHGVGALRGVQHPGDEPVFAFPDRGGCALAAHGTVHGLDGHLAGECRGGGFPGGDQALAGLAGGGGGVQRLADGLVDGVHVQAEHGADACGCRRAEVGHVVDLEFVEADAFDQVDLDFVAGGDAADQGFAVEALVLGDGEDRRDVVARVGVLGGEEGVVVVQLAHGGAVGEGDPLGGVGAVLAEDERAVVVGGVCLGHLAGDGDRAAVVGGDGDGGVVDDAVDDHLAGVFRHLHRVDCDFGDLVGQMLFNRKVLGGLMGAYFVVDHA